MNRKTYLFAGLVVVALALGACAPSEPDEIKLGFMGPLTGGAAFIGVEQLEFAKVAVEIFNEETGLNVQIVEGDTMIDPDEGKLVAERFFPDDAILVVVGPAGSQVCEATQPLFEEAGLAHITPSCTRTSLTDPGTATFFRPIPTDADQGPTVAAYMAEELGASTVFLVDDQSSYATGLSDEVAASLAGMGVAVVGTESVTQEETDFSSLATAIVAEDPDLVFFPSQIEAQMSNLIVSLRGQGWEGTYFLPDGGFGVGWVEAAGDAAEGTWITFFAPDPNNVASMAPYNEKFVANTGDEFGAFGGAGAMATEVALAAISACNDANDLTRECVITELGATNIASTILEIPVSFNANNQNAQGQFSIFQVQDGAIVLVRP